MTPSEAVTAAGLLEAAASRPLAEDEARTASAFAARLRGSERSETSGAIDHVAIYAARRAATPLMTLARYAELRR